jgi:putative ABC transport system permease protein
VVTALRRKLLRELRTSAVQLLAVASILASGVALLVALRSAARNLGEARQKYYAQCRMADFSVELKKAPLGELAGLTSIPGVAEVRPRLRFDVTVDLEGVAGPLNGMVLSLPERPAAVIDGIVLRQGSTFTDRRDEEVIVNESFARRHHLRPGARLHLLLNNRRQELVVVGTALSSEFVYLVGPGGVIPDPEHLGIFYLKQRFLEEAFAFQGAGNQVVGLLAPEAHGRVDAILREAEQRLEPYGVFSTTPRRNHPPHRFLEDYLHELATLSTTMPCIFLAVGALVLSILLARLTEQQRTAIGTLKALGYGDRQVLAHFVGFGAVVGVAGGLSGVGLGYVLSGYMTSVYRQFFDFPELDNRFYPDIAGASVLVSLGCALAAAAWGARRVLLLQPAEAMRPRAPGQGGAIFLERAAWLWRRLDTGWRMVLRNLARNRLRTLVNVFAGAMGAALLIFGLLIHGSWDGLLDFQFHQVLRSDVDLTFKEEQGRAALDEARRLPGVERAEPVLGVGCTFQNGRHERRGGITGLSPGARLTVPRDRDGHAVPVPPAGLLLTRMLAELLHVAPGDRLTVRPIRGDRSPRAVPVVAVVDSYLGLDAYADIGYLSRLLHEEYALTGVQLQVDSRRGGLATLNRALKRLPALQAVSARADIVRNLVDTLIKGNRVGTGLYVIFAAVIVFGSTLNTAMISLAERRTEVATLLTLGYGPWAVGSLFLREGLLTNLAGSLVGLPVGYLLFRGLLVLYSTELVRLPVNCPPGALVWTVGLSLLFGVVAYGVVQRSILTMDWLERVRLSE